MEIPSSGYQYVYKTHQIITQQHCITIYGRISVSGIINIDTDSIINIVLSRTPCFHHLLNWAKLPIVTWRSCQDPTKRPGFLRNVPLRPAGWIFVTYPESTDRSAYGTNQRSLQHCDRHRTPGSAD